MEDFKRSKLVIIEHPERDSKGEQVYKTSGYKEVDEIIKKLNQCFENEQQNFCYICYYLFELKKRFDNYDKNYYGRYFDKTKNYVFYETVCQSFGLEDKQIQRYLKIYAKFIELETTEKKDGAVPKLKTAFSGFSKSKLFELLSVSDSQLEKDLKSQRLKDSMSFREIREYVKSLKTGSDKADKVLETNESEEDFEITDCGQYIKFNADNFEYLKNIIKGKKYNYKDTSEVINAVLEHCREQSLFL